MFAAILPASIAKFATPIAEGIAVLALVAGLWWCVSTVIGWKDDAAKLPGVTAQLNTANQKYNDLTAHVTDKFDDVAKRLGKLQDDLTKFELTVSGNRNAIDASVRNAKGRLSHAPAPALGSPDDRNDRNVLRQLLDPTVLGPAGDAGGGGAAGQGARLPATGADPDLVPGWKPAVPTAKRGWHAAVDMPLAADRRGDGERRAAEAHTGRYGRRLAQGNRRAVPASAFGRQLPGASGDTALFRAAAARRALAVFAPIMAGAGG